MLSQWCRNPSNNSSSTSNSATSRPDSGTIQPVLDELYILQREIIQRHHPTTAPEDAITTKESRASTTSNNNNDVFSPLYKDKLLARTFWYEVRQPHRILLFILTQILVPPAPSPPKPQQTNPLPSLRPAHPPDLTPNSLTPRNTRNPSPPQLYLPNQQDLRALVVPSPWAG